MTETPTEYYVSKAPKPLRRLDYLRKRIQNWFTSLSTEGRCYAIGIACVSVAATVALSKRPETGLLAQMGAFVFALGLLPLIERLYEWAWQRLVGKLIVAALIALATNMAYGFGRQTVAGLIGTSPEPFAGTVNIATILLSPVLFLIALAVGGLFIFLIALYVGTLASMAFMVSQAPGKRGRFCLWVCRLIALGIVVFGALAVAQRTEGYSAWVSRHSAAYLYNFDMYRDTHYARGKDVKVATLSDGRLLIGAPRKSGGYTFVVREPTGPQNP